MKKILTWATALTVVIGMATASRADVFLNEFHYDNVGGDVGEFIEIVTTNNETAADITVDRYNGNDGDVYAPQTNVGDFVVGDFVDGNQYYWLELPANGLQNDLDGIAVSFEGTVVEFFSYEGFFTADEGIANGITSMDVGIVEGGGTPIGWSLQRDAVSVDVGWTAAMQTPGTVNFTAVPEPGSIVVMAFGLIGMVARRRR